MNVTAIIGRIKSGVVEEQDLCMLLSAEGYDEKILFAAADEARARQFGNRVKLRGIVEFSNYCGNNCGYCGLRFQNDCVVRYRYSETEILEAARQAIALGYGTIVLQAGEDGYYDGDKLAHIIRNIKKLADVAVTVSFGVMPEESYRKIKTAGADRYLMKHETSNAALFERLRPGTTLQERMDNLRLLKELGFQIGSGMMIGLPGTAIADYARDILLLRELQVEMAGIGPFIPHPQTPLAEYSPGDTGLTIKVVAVARLVLPATHLPATTALGTLDGDARRRVLQCGANVIMPNVSPLKNRANYEIYPGKAGTDTDAGQSHELMMKIIADAGREPALFEK